MGQPVVHFEVIGKDGENLRSYYAELFGWGFGDPIGPTNYAVVQRDGNTNADGVGIGGGVGTAPEGYRRPRHLLGRGSRRRSRAREGGEPRRDTHDGPRQGS
jgi:predicted enzyme related to lactoylglutathione lyase